jgi:SAM-dependent methyltransferase
MDWTERFTSRVENYSKYRPDYPQEVLDLLIAECNLTKESVVADAGSGTGKLSELFLSRGYGVIGIEPNRAMREAAERLLRGYDNFSSLDARAEATTLAASSVDIITAGQSFQWFETTQARSEFERILKPAGWVVLVWNDRRLAAPFLAGYEQLLLNFTDYLPVDKDWAADVIRSFFAPGRLKIRNFESSQVLDFESLKGGLLSASYSPEAGHPAYEQMLENLKSLFNRHHNGGNVVLEYDTRVFYGHLT